MVEEEARQDITCHHSWNDVTRILQHLLNARVEKKLTVAKLADLIIPLPTLRCRLKRRQEEKTDGGNKNGRRRRIA